MACDGEGSRSPLGEERQSVRVRGTVFWERSDVFLCPSVSMPCAGNLLLLGQCKLESRSVVPA